jgi:hypothetical protein
MITFPIALIVVGLIFISIHKRLNADLQSMDANYTGDLIPDTDNKMSYQQDRRIKKSFQKGSYYLGLLFLFWGIVFLIVIVFFD